jgi:hypothetical protein
LEDKIDTPIEEQVVESNPANSRYTMSIKIGINNGIDYALITTKSPEGKSESGTIPINKFWEIIRKGTNLIGTLD